MNDTPNKIIEIEQTCAIKGRYMWDNLGAARELIINAPDKNFFIVGLAKKNIRSNIARIFMVCDGPLRLSGEVY